MDKLFLDLAKDGMSINDVIEMPYQFLVELMIEKNKPKEEKSLIAAFGGSSPKA